MMLDKLSEEENVNGVNGGGNGGNCLNGGGNGGMNGMNSHKQDDNVRIYIDEPNLIDQLLMQ